MADGLKQKRDRAIADASDRVRESVKRIDVPTASEIKDLNRQANRDKEASSSAQHIPAIRARQGIKLGTMRYVWGFSLILAIAAMIIVYLVTVG